MPNRRKVPLLIVTNLGFLVIVASIVRTVHFCRVVNKPDFSCQSCLAVSSASTNSAQIDRLPYQRGRLSNRIQDSSARLRPTSI